jgi:hypothetical protein
MTEHLFYTASTLEHMFDMEVGHVNLHPYVSFPLSVRS